MTPRYAYIVGYIGLISLAQGQIAHGPAAATAKSSQSWTPPRTADGHPDFSGAWVNNIATPLERPAALAGREFLTDDEVAAMKEKGRELFNGQGDAAFFDGVFSSVYDSIKSGKPTRSGLGGVGSYNSFWMSDRDWDNRTSLITDPRDGRLPPMTAAGQRRNAAGFSNKADGPEDRPLAERCITYGSPSLVAGYQSGYWIEQSPGAVVIETEMIHDARVIPMDGHPHLPSAVRQWMGDSRGHWEGDTLVVDTTNYKPRSFRNVSSEKLHVVERLTRTSAENLEYRITIDDPDTWTKPWSLMIPLKRTSGMLLEYACHEGNYGIAGVLSGARAQERETAAKQER
jgi:hypothetical protein